MFFLGCDHIAIQTLNNEIEKLSGQDQFDACKNRGSCEDPVERQSAFRKYKSSSPPFNPRPRNQDHTSHDDKVGGIDMQKIQFLLFF